MLIARDQHFFFSCRAIFTESRLFLHEFNYAISLPWLDSSLFVSQYKGWFFTRSCCSSIIFIIGVAVSNFKRARTPSPELPNKMAPVKDLIEQSIKDNLVMIFSKSTCPFCKKVGYLMSAFNHSIFSKNKGSRKHCFQNYGI